MLCKNAVFLTLATAIFVIGCGEDEPSKGGVLMVDAGPDMGPSDMGSSDPYADYCQRFSKAKCDYIFGCVSGGYVIQALFGLPGSTAERCTEQAAASCVRDLRDRVERGTVEFTDSAIDVCVQQVSSRPCIGSNPSEWAHQWHDFVANYCGGVARGNVQTGDGCVARSDCNARHDVCIEGVCRTVTSQDLKMTCQAEGTVGTLRESDTCPTGWCMHTEYGGTCTVDCRTGRGCAGDGLACLRLEVANGPANSFCVAECTLDAQCGDLGCQPLDSMDPMSDTFCMGPVGATPQ